MEATRSYPRGMETDRCVCARQKGAVVWFMMSEDLFAAVWTEGRCGQGLQGQVPGAKASWKNPQLCGALPEASS